MLIIRNDNGKTHKDINLEKHKHKKNSHIKKQMKIQMLSKAKKNVQKMADRRQNMKQKMHKKLMISFVFLTRL